MADTLVIPHQFDPAVGDQPAADLDSDFAVIAAWVNARTAAFGPLASRPAAGNPGAMWVATDQNNTVYLDNGTAWVQVTFPTGGATTVGLIVGLPRWVPLL